jgi:hypothetical protein
VNISAYSRKRYARMQKNSTVVRFLQTVFYFFEKEFLRKDFKKRVAHQNLPNVYPVNMHNCG